MILTQLELSSKLAMLVLSLLNRRSILVKIVEQKDRGARHHEDGKFHGGPRIGGKKRASSGGWMGILGHAVASSSPFHGGGRDL